MRRYLKEDFLWLDDEKDLGIDVPKMLSYLGWPDTRQNRDIAAEALKEMMAELYPDIPHYETSIAKGFQQVHRPTRQN